MKKSKSLIYSLIILTIVTLSLIFFIDVKLVITIASALLLIILYICYKEKIGQEGVIALLFALVITSYYLYEYTTTNILIGRINLFPLLAWTVGLVILREIYEKLKTRHKFLLISLSYISALFLVEYMGFYIFKIQLNTDFPSLLRLGIIHAPLGMKFFYIFAGPLYILITDYIKVK